MSHKSLIIAIVAQGPYFIKNPEIERKRKS